MIQVLLFLIVASLTPVCIPLFRGDTLSGRFWTAIVATAFSAALQAFFVVCAGRSVLPLDYSLRFSIAGIPACILAIVIALRAQGSWRPGATISPSLGLALWAFLMTVH